MRFLMIITLSLFCLSPAVGQNPQANTPQWESLFNGRDLSGWNKVGNEKWVVEDGVIYGEGITEEYGYLATEKTYEEFDLALRFKCEASGNSGVYIHTTFEPGTATVTKGRQIEIDRAIGKHTGGIYGDGKGWIVWPAPELETDIKSNDWNDLRIKVVGTRHMTYLNGVKMVDFTYPSPVVTSGVIALQLHSGGEGRMRFKDLWIRDLSGKKGISRTRAVDEPFQIVLRCVRKIFFRRECIEFFSNSVSSPAILRQHHSAADHCVSLITEL